MAQCRTVIKPWHVSMLGPVCIESLTLHLAHADIYRFRLPRPRICHAKSGVRLWDFPEHYAADHGVRVIRRAALPGVCATHASRIPNGGPSDAGSVRLAVPGRDIHVVARSTTTI